jgi:pyruvoyl-dependent arginine decarboxylase (PvlArgDC)
MAKIENFNVVPYTSCIPAEANEVKVEDVRHVFHHGAVLEVIQAVMCAPLCLGTLGARVGQIFCSTGGHVA